ncbi:MAG: hypothetical protein CMF39_06320 [Legionellaceae bacterium]|nr:hypothetical protein [Legionellaceae bacterium]|tara:strand:- start:1810 stop:2232 length:423 start_codon:yes stop_codon:yes gene_type:complete
MNNNKQAILMGVLLLLTGCAMANPTCSSVLANHHWAGTANEGGVSVSINQLSFNSDLTEMTIADSVDPKPLSTPVHVTCLTHKRFALVYSNHGQDDPSMLNLHGRITHTAAGSYSLSMSGTKKVYQKNQEVPVSLDLGSM